MTPRLLVVCLGGLAGAGALVCCDLDDGAETDPAALDGDPTEEPTLEAEAAEPDAVH